MAHDVFISYSHHDKPQADAVCATLEAKGIRCWIAPRDVVPGQEWGAAIVDAIRSSRVMVLVFSSHANASPQIRREVERAVSADSVLIPFRIEDVVPSESLEYFLGTPHWLDALTPPLEAHLERLAAAVTSFLDVHGHSDASSPVTPRDAPAMLPADQLTAGSAKVPEQPPSAVDDSLSTQAQPEDPVSAKSSDTPFASATKETLAPSANLPLFQRLSQRTKIAAAALLTVTVVAVCIGVIVSRQPSRPPRPQISQASRPPQPPAANTTPGPIQLPFTGAFTAVRDPIGVAVDAGGNVYVTSQGTAYGSTGLVLKLAAGSTAPTRLPFPPAGYNYSVAVDTAGNVYAAHGHVLYKLAAGSTTPTQLTETTDLWLEGVAVDTDGNIYLLESSGVAFGVTHNAVLKLTAGSTTPTQLAPFTDSLMQPEGIAVDGSGDVYVADTGHNQVVELASGANTITQLPFTGLKAPRGVAIDSSGSVYVVDKGSSNNRVLKLAAAAPAQTELPFPGLYDADGVAVDNAGNVYVADSGHHRVLKLASETQTH